MQTLRSASAAALIALSGCCLTVVGDGTGNDGDTGGSSTTGASSSGGATTGAAIKQCSGVFCSPSYVCDPTDGICKCGGQVCDTGNCDANAGTCLPRCNADAGVGSVNFATTGEATVLHDAIANVDYSFQILAVACEPGPIGFTLVLPSPLQTYGLNFFGNGLIAGFPSMATPAGMPIEFEVQAQGPEGEEGSQNFLLTIDGNNH